jgi:hypothetical protein
LQSTSPHFWWERKLVQQSWKIAWMFPNKLKIEIQCGPANPVIPSTQDPNRDIWITVPCQSKQIVWETLPQKQNKTKQNKPSQERAGGVTQGVGPEFTLQHCKKGKWNWYVIDAWAPSIHCNTLHNCQDVEPT